jgi:flavodoxin
MKTTIFYFTGTGNSRKLAQDLAIQLENTKLISIAGLQNKNIDLDPADDCIGLIFPIYSWGIPSIVRDFCQNLKTDKYLFVVMNYGSNPGYTLNHVKSALKTNGTNLSAGFGLAMPDNFMPLFRNTSNDAQLKVLKDASATIKQIAEAIKKREKYLLPVNYSVKNWILSNPLNKLWLHFHKKSDKFFWANDKCNTCGQCQAVCPVCNIKLVHGRPQWQCNCQCCLACIHWCPQQAIQYGRFTDKKERYQNPEINLKQIIESRKKI